MSASYEKLIEEFYKADKSKLERALESDADQTLNDDGMRHLLKEYIRRLHKDSNLPIPAMRTIKYFELLSSVNNIEDFRRELEQLNNFSSKVRDLSLDDESSCSSFVKEQKKQTCLKIDGSDEYKKFKEHLRRKYRRRRHR